MRLTTKIVIGIILAIFLLTLINIIGFSFSDRRHYNHSFQRHPLIQISQDKVDIPIEPSRVVVLELDQTNNSVFYLLDSENGFFIHPPVTSDDENKLFIPKSLNDCVSFQTKGDTLVIKINIDKVMEKNAYQIETFERKETRHAVSSQTIGGINLYLYISNVRVINTVRGIQTLVHNIVTDSIIVHSHAKISIDSCKANVIEPYCNQLTVTNCVAKSLFLDLDRINNWDIDNCDIERRIFTGSKRNHSITTNVNEVASINWLPKNKDASLNMTFKGDSVQITTQPIKE